ncbi:MAG: hypothetical protein Q9226_004323 [Calogaya cf. arnoldii]
MLSRPFRSPLLKRPGSDENENPPTKKAKVQPTGLVFKKPGISILPRKPLLAVDNTAPTSDVAGTEGHYSVLYRNVTKKKHKTWEGYEFFPRSLIFGVFDKPQPPGPSII